MTEEEKEAMRQEAYLRQLKIWKQEEAQMVCILYLYVVVPLNFFCSFFFSVWLISLFNVRLIFFILVCASICGSQ